MGLVGNEYHYALPNYPLDCQSCKDSSQGGQLDSLTLDLCSRLKDP